MKKVTIAIALYNNESYIEKCMQSVLNQSFENLEVLIVDDGSSDGSIKKCQQFLYDMRVQLINKQNGGLSSSRQIGLERATGDYICFIDADDYLHGNYVLELLTAVIEKNADMAVCNTIFVDEQDRVLTKESELFTLLSKWEDVVDTSRNLEEEYCTYASGLFMSDSWNKIYRVEYLRKTKTRFELSKEFNGTDLVFNYKILLHKPRVCLVRKSLYYHVIHASSAVHRKGKKLQSGFFEIIDRIIAENIEFENKDYYSQFSKLYVKFSYEAFLDQYEENYKKRSECRKVLNDMVVEHQLFMDRHENIIKIDIFAVNRPIQRVFAATFKYCSRYIYYVFCLRGMMKMLQKGENNEF